MWILGLEGLSKKCLKKKQIEKRNITRCLDKIDAYSDEIYPSSRSSFLHSHHYTLDRRRTTYIVHCFESVKRCRLDKSTLVNIGVNFSHVRDYEVLHKDQVSPMAI